VVVAFHEGYKDTPTHTYTHSNTFALALDAILKGNQKKATHECEL
jgi:hypothetical protein